MLMNAVILFYLTKRQVFMRNNNFKTRNKLRHNIGFCLFEHCLLVVQK